MNEESGADGIEVNKAGPLRVPERDGIYRRAMGHFWTLAPTVRHKIFPRSGPATKPWRMRVQNEWGDPILRSGCYTLEDDEKVLVVLFHGLGGTIDRAYSIDAALEAQRKGFSCLRLALRGADGLGTDLHHAGYTDDLATILKSEPWSGYEKIALVGHSLGGHVALTAAAKQIDSRISAAIAICPPLDLQAAQAGIDSRAASFYRKYLLRGLKQTYPVIARNPKITIPVERINEVTTLREWDAVTVVPRFGFRDVHDYYETQSVGPRLAKMSTPSLVIASPGDPMIPADSLRGALSRASEKVEVRWVRHGGHVFFPPDVDLGFGDRPGVDAQIMDWINNVV